MTLGDAILLYAIVFAAGDIHRCDEPEGIRYQDQPCEGEQGSVLRAGPQGTNIDPQQVRSWLEELGPHSHGDGGQPGGAPPVPETRRSIAPEPLVELAPRPDSSVLQASCSVLFYECTNGDAAYTDGCVSELMVCAGDQRYGCCHTAFIERYQSLREAGASLRTAIKVSLLGSRRESEDRR